MKKSESIAALSAALSTAQAKMPRVSFDATNPFLHNKYASLGAVIEASRPVLAEQGLSICQLPFNADSKIGVESVLVHKSGEWISEALALEIGEEKGKSRAQVAGSIITYLRRYAWASILGLYADEDTDGNAPKGKDAPRTEPKPAARPQAQPVQQPKASNGKTPTPATREWMIKELKADASPVREIATDFFRKAGALLPNEGIEVLPLRFVASSREELAKLTNAISEFESGSEALLPYKPHGEAAISEPEREGPPPSEIEAWRVFPMPYGKNAGIPLGELDKKYLFGLAMNYKVETEYNGKPKSQQSIEKDRLFRRMLDDCMPHYGWKAETI